VSPRKVFYNGPAVAFWQEALLTALVVLVLAPLGRLIYVRVFLKKQLFIQPWSNLSRDEQFSTGEALAELLTFELERVQSLLYRARTGGGLWNENTVALPQFHRSSDGYPSLLKDVEEAGLPGPLTKVLVFILRAKPPALRGSVQKYGAQLRLQLSLDGVRRASDLAHERQHEPPGRTSHEPSHEPLHVDTSTHGGRTSQAQGSPLVRSWATTVPVDRPEEIPAAVADLAHQALRDLCAIQGFKSPDAFRAFASALQDHLDYNNVKRTASFENAMAKYEDAIRRDGSNALAACNLADLLYVQYTDTWNEQAIERYTEALNTDNLALRARAFRGLANASCQKYQRYKHKERPIVDTAVRAAHAASLLCQERPAGIGDHDVASILKAEAYAHQVFAEEPNLTGPRRDQLLAQAAALYERAIAHNHRFAIAHNNLGYLHLENAKALFKSARGNGQSGDTIAAILDRLDQADMCCDRAVQSDRTFYMSYDNRGNVARLRARVEAERAAEQLDAAVDSYHEALSYKPKYTEALKDLAKAHIQLHALRTTQNDRHEHAELAWHYHWQSLSCTDDDTVRRHQCRDFVVRCATDWPAPPMTSDARARLCTCAGAGVAR
jgi:tetratricopeptide (TPR) repeat protein